jgi:hypothetical protein
MARETEASHVRQMSQVIQWCRENYGILGPADESRYSVLPMKLWQLKPGKWVKSFSAAEEIVASQARHMNAVFLERLSAAHQGSVFGFAEIFRNRKAPEINTARQNAYQRLAACAFKSSRLSSPPAQSSAPAHSSPPTHSSSPTHWSPPMRDRWSRKTTTSNN